MTTKPICGAKNRRGGRCSVAPMPNGKCYRHGGATPIGPANANFIHGRHSKMLKDVKGLGAHYDRALEDPDLLRLDAEIALIDARLLSLLEKVKGPNASIDGIWPQIDALIESRRKVVDTESKRLKDLHAMLSVDRVLLIIRYLQDAVRKHVKDPAEQTAVFEEIRRLLKPEQALTA